MDVVLYPMLTIQESLCAFTISYLTKLGSLTSPRLYLCAAFVAHSTNKTMSLCKMADPFIYQAEICFPAV